MLSSNTAMASGIRRPPFLYLACLVLGFALDRLLPLPLSYPQAGLICSIGGGALILTGVAIIAAGARNFSRAGTPVPSNQPVRALVTSGIHSWSRNPIYVGMLLVYAGIGTAAPARDEPAFLTQGADSKEELGDLEHQVGDRLALGRCFS